MKPWIWAVAVFAVISVTHAAPGSAQDRDLPADVADYAVRRVGCAHWGGEESYDAARGREIAATVKQLRCDDLDRDEKALRRRHKADPAALRALDRANDADG